VTTPPAHTVAEISELLESGASTALDLTKFYLARIASLNPRLNAVLATDETGALDAASASDARRAAGRTLGPLDGVPALIKDNIEAVGLPGSAGSRALAGSAPTEDAPVVSRMRAAGLVVLGSTNLSEWANFRSTASTSGWSALGGQTDNPYRAGRNTSGSSSGSAVAAAAGLAPITVGTETDGSIVSPAGVCGAVGFKPTLGTVPGARIVPISSRQDTAGPITRCVADAAALYGVLAGHEISIRPIELSGLTVSVWRPDGLTEPAAGILERAAELLAASGCRLTTGAADPTGPFHNAEFEALVAEFAAELPAYLAGRPGAHPQTWAELLAFNRADDTELSRFSDEIFSLAEQAPGLDSDDYRKARDRADTDAAQALDSIFGSTTPADLAITLTNLPAWPTKYGQADEDHLSTSSPAAVTGSPSLSLPGGFVDDLPVGITVLGRRGQDRQVLDFAAALERLLPPRRDPDLG
jgi:amidase